MTEAVEAATVQEEEEEGEEEVSWGPFDGLLGASWEPVGTF